MSKAKLRKEIGHCSPYGWVSYPSKGIEIEFSDDCDHGGHKSKEKIEPVELSDEEFESWFDDREPGYYYHTYNYYLDGQLVPLDAVIARYLEMDDSGRSRKS